MKHINVLFALSTFLLLCGTASAAEVVLDTSGETVTPFDEYYILPFNFALGGGLSLTNNTNGNKTCPVDIIKEFSEVENGMPLKIIPVPRIGFVPTSTSLRISFVTTPDCTQSSEWILVKEEAEKHCWFVGIGSPEDHPCSETMTGHFKIEKHENKMGYKLMFCSNSMDRVCGNISIAVDEDNNRRLSLSDGEAAYEIVFRKANTDSDSDI